VKQSIKKNLQYYKFSFYGFFKNLRFFESFLILFFLEKGLSYVEIGFLYSIRSVVIVVSEIPSGAIADALGRRRTLLMAFLVYIFSFLTFYYSDSFMIMAAAMMLFAFADAFRSGVHKAMILHYLQVNNIINQKTNYYGHTRSWSQRGSAVSSLIAAVIVIYSGNFQIIFLASVIPYLLDMMLVWSYPKWLDGELKEFDALTVKQKFGQVGQGLSQSFKSKAFLKTLVSTSLYTGYFKAVKDYVQPVIKMLALSAPVLAYWNDDKKTALFIGVFYFVVYLLTAWISRNAGVFQNKFSNYLKPMNLTILFGFIAGIISGLFYLLGWYALAVAVFVFILMVENLRKPIGVTVISDLSSNKAMATVLSLSSQAKSVFAAIIAPVIGLIAEQYGPGIGIAVVSLLLIAGYPLYRLSNK
jgi:MFS family permease